MRPQRSLSSKSLGKYWRLNRTTNILKTENRIHSTIKYPNKIAYTKHAQKKTGIDRQYGETREVIVGRKISTYIECYTRTFIESVYFISCVFLNMLYIFLLLFFLYFNLYILMSNHCVCQCSSIKKLLTYLLHS